jgi:hypothetical protein
MSSPGSEQTGSVTEAFGGFPSLAAASASDVNVKLGTLSDPKVLCIWGEQGISFKIASDGDSIAAYPFACICDLANGLGISEIWVSNGEDSEKSYTIVAFE